MKENEKRHPMVKVLYEIMATGGWYTLPELRHELQRRGRVALDTSVSARLRDLRKSPWNRTVWVRPRGASAHTQEYSLMTGGQTTAA
jgi:hypothetical protein